MWPELDLRVGSDEWLAKLFKRTIAKFIVQGYSKADGNPFAQKERKPFEFSMEVFAAQFAALAEGATTQRRVIDAYLSAFFSAWNADGGAAAKKWFLGFCPRLVAYRESTDGFFRDYPDGRLICSVRNPLSWYASSQRHDPEYADIERALGLWTASTTAALRLARERPGAVHILTYDALVEDTRGVMAALAEALGIEMADSLLQPTFAGEPVLPNSSFAVGEHGVHRQSLDAGGRLTAAQKDYIERVAAGLYSEAEAAALRPRAGARSAAISAGTD